MPRRNCLKRPMSPALAVTKCSGAKLGTGGYSMRSPTYTVSPTRSAWALTKPMMSPASALSTAVVSRPKTDWANFVVNGRPVPAWVTTMPRSNVPETTRA